MEFMYPFLAGIFFANGVPHFGNGISGRSFHSPFAKPPGKGHSSAVVNVIWGCTNFAAAHWILQASETTISSDYAFTVPFFAGLLLTGVILGFAFERFRVGR